MFAARDQENLVHAHQTAAAGKPLNQNIRALHPKTPSNLKTPFRANQNDENQPFHIKGLQTGGKPGASKIDKNAFVTPLAPRNRAPLGAKTTNAKANAFKTPAPVLPTAKPGRSTHKLSSTKRSAKSKIHVAQAEPVEGDVLTQKVVEEDEPEFGFAPPPLADMPDPPLEVERDQLLRDLPRTAREFYGSPKGEHAMSLRLQREEEEHQRYLEEQEHKMLESDAPIFPSGEELNAQVDAMIAAGPRKDNSAKPWVDTVKARAAVEALSSPASQPRLPSAITRPTKASAQKARGPLGLLKQALPPSATTSTRSVPTNVSKNTIGFPKARKPASIIPAGVQHARKPSRDAPPKTQKVDQSSIHPRDFRDLYGSPPAESDMWFRLKEYELLEESLKDESDSLAEDLFETDFFPFENSKMDEEDFQLPVPE